MRVVKKIKKQLVDIAIRAVQHRHSLPFERAGVDALFQIIPGRAKIHDIETTAYAGELLLLY